MITKDEIPKNIRDVIFGNGSQFLIECIYAWEKAEYRKAHEIASRHREGSYKTDRENVEYFGKRMMIAHEAWIKFQDNEDRFPYNLIFK